MSDVVEHGSQRMRRWYSERGIENELSGLRAYLRQCMDVLDVGCGPGTVTLDVARLVDPGRVVGVDLAPPSVGEATAKAREAGVVNVSYEVGDAVDLAFDDGSFDLAYSTNLLPFVRDPVRALTEQRRVARPGGWVIAQTDDRVASVVYPPCPAVERLFASLAAASDPSTGSFVADFAFARKAYGKFLEAGFRRVELCPAHPQHAWVYAGSPLIGSFYMFVQEGPLSPAARKLVSTGAIDEETLDAARREVDSWREHPHAFYMCPSVLVAGQV